MFEVREFRDLGDNPLAERVLETPRPTGDHRVPIADLGGEGLDVPLFPEPTFIRDRLQDSDLGGGIE